LFMERLRFFDRFLKGVENGIDREPPIYIYVMNGEGWRFEGEWPLGRQQTINYYFAGGNTLTTTHPTSNGSDQYQVDFKTSGLYNGISRWHVNVSYASEILKRTDEDLKCLTYTSAPLEQDVEVTGHPVVNLWVSSTADDGDFFVYLEDVDDTGEALYITDGMLRANFAGGLTPNEDILLPGADSIDVLPDLPWHGFRESDYIDGVFAGGEKANLIFDLMPTSWVFKKGHRIRVSIAGADYPTFELHPELSPSGEPDDPENIVPEITAYRDAEYPSFVSLPVIPVKPTAFEGTVEVKADRKGFDEVPAELYTFETAVYLHFDDQWLKWDTTAHWQEGMVEYYKCEGELGKLSVLVQTNDNASFEVLASGQGVHFKGVAQ
jgi:putative CocE/NonD family hydrolase